MGDKLIRERYEDGKRIISVDTAEEFGQVLDQADNYRVETEAPEEVIEAFGVMDSTEELGIEPDEEGLFPGGPRKSPVELRQRVAISIMALFSPNPRGIPMLCSCTSQ